MVSSFRSTAIGLLTVAALSWHVQAGALQPAELSRVASRYNVDLPREVAADVRQERVQAVGMTLTFAYTFLSHSASQVRRSNFAENRRAALVPGLCGAPDTGRMLREGTTFRYVYYGSDGQVGAKLDVSASACRVR